MDYIGLLDAKVDVVRIKHAIVRKMINKRQPADGFVAQQLNELNMYENQALAKLHIDCWKDMKKNNPSLAKKLIKMMVSRVDQFNKKCKQAKAKMEQNETLLSDSCHTETGYAY